MQLQCIMFFVRIVFSFLSVLCKMLNFFVGAINAFEFYGLVARESQSAICEDLSHHEVLLLLFSRKTKSKFGYGSQSGFLGSSSKIVFSPHFHRPSPTTPCQATGPHPPDDINPVLGHDLLL